VYQPWRWLPFQIVDFSEFLPFLIGGRSFPDRFSAVTQYYAERGRFNPIQHGFTVLYWSLFGANAAGWQLFRFGWMFALAAAVHLLLRRLGSGRAGALAGSALFLFAGSTIDHWLSPHLAEPLGLAFVLGASWIAAGYQESDGWRVRGAAIAGLLALAAVTKEMLFACVPFVLALGCCWRGGAAYRPRVTVREGWLIGATALACAVAAIPIVLTYLSAPAEGYSQAYGQADLGAKHLAGVIATFFLPTGAAWMPLPKTLLYPANTLFLATLAGGAYAALSRRRSPSTNGSRVPVAVIAALLPVAGVLAYLPWPNTFDYYGYPFLVGVAWLLAQAVTAVEVGVPKLVRWASYAACVGVVAYTAVPAHRAARARAARRLTDAAAARALSGYTDRAVVLVGINFPLPAHQRWQGLAETLRRYALVVDGARTPALVDVACADAAPVARRAPRDTIVLVYAGNCAEFPREVPPPGWTVRTPYAYRSWKSWRSVPDSSRADFWTGATEGAGGRAR